MIKDIEYDDDIAFLFDIVNKQPYPYQIDFVNDSSPKKIINKSRQLGFSYLAGAIALSKALEGLTVLIVSPSERQSKHLINYTYEFINGMKELDIEVELIEESRMSLRFKNNGAIYSLPNSPNTVRGFKADIIIFDEFAHFLNGTDKEIYEAVLPSLSRGGELWLISTPYGERGIYYDVWKNAEKHGFKRFTYNYRDCPDLNVDEIKKTMDIITFKQEYENEFIGDVNSYFSYDLLGACTVENIIRDPTAEIYIGIDIGRRSDFTAICIIQKPIDGICSLIHFEKLRNVPFKEQENRIIELIKQFNPHQVLIDEGGIGMQLTEELKKDYGIVRGVTFTNELKSIMMIELKRLFESKEIQITDNRDLIGALHMIERVQAGGSVKYESDRSDEFGHGDAAWSLALAAYGIKTQERYVPIDPRLIFG